MLAQIPNQRSANGLVLPYRKRSDFLRFISERRTHRVVPRRELNKEQRPVGDDRDNFTAFLIRYHEFHIGKKRSAFGGERKLEVIRLAFFLHDVPLITADSAVEIRKALCCCSFRDNDPGRGFRGRRLRPWHSATQRIEG